MTPLRIEQVDLVTREAIVVVLSDGRVLMFSLEDLLVAKHRVLEDLEEETD